MHSYPLLILLCFIAVGNTANAMYFFGQNYSKCLHENTNTSVVLECGQGNDWNYNGGRPDATKHLIGVQPLPDSCIVCYFVLAIVQTTMYTHVCMCVHS